MLFCGLLDVVDGTHQSDFPELPIPRPRSLGSALRALDAGEDGFSHRSLPVKIVVNPGVVGVIVWLVDAVLDQRSDA